MKPLIQKRKVNLGITLNFGKMKLDKEKFNKLKQLDRIEFRQKLDRIEDTGFSLIGCLFCMIMVISIFFSALIISQEITGEVNMVLFDINVKVFGLFFFLMFIEFPLVIGFSLLRSKHKKELFEEYFLIEVKK